MTSSYGATLYSPFIDLPPPYSEPSAPSLHDVSFAESQGTYCVIEANRNVAPIPLTNTQQPQNFRGLPIVYNNVNATADDNVQPTVNRKIT